MSGAPFRSMTIRQKFSITIGLIVTAIIAGYMMENYLTERSLLLQDIDEDLLGSALWLQTDIAADYHDSIIDRESVSPEEYAHIVEKNDHRCLDLGLQYLWSCMKVGDQIVFTTASSTSKDVRNGDYAAFFDVHKDPHAFDAVFEVMKPVFSSFQNQWGHGRMVLVPSKDRLGRKVCFGASISIDKVQTELMQTLQRSLLVGIGFLGVSLLVSLRVAQTLTKPIVQLAKVAGEMARGRMDLPIVTSGATELVSLGQSLSAMQNSVCQKIGELEAEVIERKHAENELQRVSRAKKTLIACDRALVRMTCEAEMLEEICRIISESIETKMTWIGYAENDAGKTVRPSAQVGGDDEYLTQAQETWADVPQGQGPVGTAIRTRKVDQCLNIPDNPRFALWRESAKQRGFASIIAFPLLNGDQCLGALCIYSSQAEGFNNEEIELFEQLADNLAFGIITSRTRDERCRLQMELLRISEREKQLIAMELHDGLCQNLAGIAIMSSVQHLQLEEKGWPESKSAKEIRDLLYTTVNEARNLSHGLYPVSLEGGGLMKALAQLAGTVCNLFGIDCTFVCPEPVFFENESVGNHLFRITQEAINNARKHGQAGCVIIGLRQTSEGWTLTIEDNGVGIAEDIPPQSGLGLKIMNYRAFEIGANISVRRANANAGTVVTCTLPSSNRHEC